MALLQRTGYESSLLLQWPVAIIDLQQKKPFFLHSAFCTCVPYLHLEITLPHHRRLATRSSFSHPSRHLAMETTDAATGVRVTDRGAARVFSTCSIAKRQLQLQVWSSPCRLATFDSKSSARGELYAFPAHLDSGWRSLSSEKNEIKRGVRRGGFHFAILSFHTKITTIAVRGQLSSGPGGERSQHSGPRIRQPTVRP